MDVADVDRFRAGFGLGTDCLNGYLQVFIFGAHLSVGSPKILQQLTFVEALNLAVALAHRTEVGGLEAGETVAAARALAAAANAKADLAFVISARLKDL